MFVSPAYAGSEPLEPLVVAALLSKPGRVRRNLHMGPILVK